MPSWECNLIANALLKCFDSLLLFAFIIWLFLLSRCSISLHENNREGCISSPNVGEGETVTQL